jgi:putative addiction module component (TIGR02574 family)
MNQPPFNINTLPKEERLSLLEAFWDSLNPEQDILITPSQKAELIKRSRALAEGTLKTLPVNNVLKAIRSKNVSV